MTDQDTFGRFRILAVAFLVILIGVLGAIILSPLLDEPRRPGPVHGDATVGIEVPEAGIRAGQVRIRVRRAGNRVWKASAVLEPDADAKAAASTLRQAIASQGDSAWATRTGSRLTLDAVQSVGGDPGTTGVALALSLTSSTEQPMGLVVGWQGDVAPISTPGAVRLWLVAHPSAKEIAGGNFGRQIEERIPLEIGPRAALLAFANALAENGFSVEHAVEGPTQILIRTLPDGLRIGAAMLTVAYELEPGEAPPTGYWTVGLAGRQGAR